jgi:hypothetical protein
VCWCNKLHAGTTFEAVTNRDSVSAPLKLRKTVTLLMSLRHSLSFTSSFITRCYLYSEMLPYSHLQRCNVSGEWAHTSRCRSSDWGRFQFSVVPLCFILDWLLIVYFNSCWLCERWLEAVRICLVFGSYFPSLTLIFVFISVVYHVHNLHVAVE